MQMQLIPFDPVKVKLENVKAFRSTNTCSTHSVIAIKAKQDKISKTRSRPQASIQHHHYPASQQANALYHTADPGPINGLAVSLLVPNPRITKLDSTQSSQGYSIPSLPGVNTREDVQRSRPKVVVNQAKTVSPIVSSSSSTSFPQSTPHFSIDSK